jgi:hypothetical protein
MSTEDGATHEADARFDALEDRLEELRDRLGLPSTTGVTTGAAATGDAAVTVTPSAAEVLSASTPDATSVAARASAERVAVVARASAGRVAVVARASRVRAVLVARVSAGRAAVVARASRARGAVVARASAVRVSVADLVERRGDRSWRDGDRRRIEVAVAIVVLSLAVASFVAVLVMAIVTGGRASVARTDSGAPVVRTGDVVVTAPVDVLDLRVGMSVLATATRGTIAGRIVDIGSVDGRSLAVYTSPDLPLEIVAAGDVLAEVRAIVVLVGWPVVWLGRLPGDAGAWAGLLLLVGTIAAALAVVRPRPGTPAPDSAPVLEEVPVRGTRARTSDG